MIGLKKLPRFANKGAVKGCGLQNRSLLHIQPLNKKQQTATNRALLVSRNETWTSVQLGYYGIVNGRCSRVNRG
jgi:hypothetical protein